jgi:hypothetical protein
VTEITITGDTLERGVWTWKVATTTLSLMIFYIIDAVVVGNIWYPRRHRHRSSSIRADSTHWTEYLTKCERLLKYPKDLLVNSYNKSVYLARPNTH